MNQLDHLFDVFVEETKRVRVGEHHADDGIVAGSFERFEVHIAAFIRRDGHNLQYPSCRPKRDWCHARRPG